jgi:glycosyltransferase involved in cell wall biosynthesis
MKTPVRLTTVLTHPIQYYAPWFRHIHAHAPEIALTVVYATHPTAQQQGVGFDRAFEWDVPLLDGYESITVRAPEAGDQVDTSRFMGLDAPGIGDAVLATKPDVVMIAGWYSISLVRALVACRRHGIPTLYRGDSNLLSGPGGWRRTAWGLKTRALLKQFDGFLSPGRHADEYLTRYGAPGYRIFHVPHGVDNDLFATVAAERGNGAGRAAARASLGLRADAFVALFAGKMVARKRPLDLVRAAAALGGGITVLTAGSGPLDAEMQAEARRLGVDLKAMGFLNQTELGAAYAVADCLVLPSDSSETWGLVVNEALASGLPVAVSDEVGCAPDLVTHDTGAVFPRGEVAALASALAALRARKDDGYDWSPACRAVADAHGFAAMTTGLVRACRSVIRHSPGAEPDWSASAQRIVAPCGQMVIAGGLERMTFEVLRVLRGQGMPAHAIVNEWENFRITPMAEASGASWSVGPYWHTLRRRGITPAMIVRMLIEIVRVSGDLVRVSRRVRPTHVLVPDFVAVLRNVLGLAWLRARGVRVIARLGTAPPPGTFYRHLWRRAVDPVVDVFVANSEFTRRELLAHGIKPEKVTTIENIAPPRKPQAAPVDAVRIPGRIVFVGQIIPDKGLDLLLDAIGQLRRGGIDATLDVVGQIDGWEAPEYRGYRAALRERAQQPDLAGTINFLGFREDVPALLASASLHCCPSRPEHREGFGLVVLEAKISGLPSIVTPSGNLPEMIEHQRDGWVCARPDAPAIAAGLEYFLSRPGELAAAGRAAHASSFRYSESRFAAAWTRLFATAQIEHAHAT